MRTIKRISDVINTQKWQAIKAIATAYAREKNHWLNVFQQKKHFKNIKRHREIRNNAVLNQYQSPYKLQARMWKLALIDAAETMDRYWQSIFEKIKSEVYRNKNLSVTERHYCFWLLKDTGRTPAILEGKIVPFGELSEEKRKKSIRFLQRKINKYRKNYPRVKLNKSFALDANCYTCFEHNDTQYLKFMSLEKGRRIVVPLKGATVIGGNIRIVLGHKNVTVHYTSQIKPELQSKNREQKVTAIDLGYTEVMVDDKGHHYGGKFGKNLTEISDWLKNKMIKRHKLHALHKKYAASDNKIKQEKAKNIKKYNLGKIKLNNKLLRQKSTSLTIINTAFNQLLDKTKAPIVVSEDLSHSFSYGKYKNMNRRLSSWLRHSLNERLSFKALVKGFDHQQVNPAYTSQTCPNPSCGYVDAANRCKHNKDKFKCLHCGTEGHSDVFAAINLKARYFDREITRYTPYAEVKKILRHRFHHRLETRLSGTVSGRIPDTHQHSSTEWSQSESEYQKTKSHIGYV